jgi:hypothetical protein
MKNGSQVGGQQKKTPLGDFDKKAEPFGTSTKSPGFADSLDKTRGIR